MRLIAGIVVLALVGALLYGVMGPGPKPDPTPPGGFTTSEQCKSCHEQVYDEWQTSWHSQAWIDPDVRALSNDFANVDCIDCHAPQDLFITGMGQRVLPRAERRSEGVDCLACHRLPESMGGGVAGTTDHPTAACRPQIRTELARVEYCASCHNQHNTVDQWRESRFAKKGADYKDCRDCHMPLRTGPGAKGRSHVMHGGHDLELVRSGIRLGAARQGDQGTIRVEVENFGVGHAFPTDERSRAADVFWRVQPSDPNAQGGWKHLYRIRSPYRSEVDIPRTLIDAGQTLQVDIDDPLAKGP
ncbi:MAG TPA: cytochrome c3 family protein, partial [Planctomycetota bacterium]|nr:cytochrome c3 family protein [Planctomycetota bacterium]